MKPLVIYYSQIFVVYQVRGCTKNACFIKSKHFSCSVSSTLTVADVRRGDEGWSNADRGRCGGKNGHFVRTSFMDGPLVLRVSL